MALFSRKKNTEKPAKAVEKAETVRSASALATPRAGTVASVLRSPRITEKATMHTGESAYLFDVAPNATKHDIAQAVAAVYKVTPRMVRVITVPSKRKRNSRTGERGVKKGGKKAYVYLKKGETITVT